MKKHLQRLSLATFIYFMPTVFLSTYAQFAGTGQGESFTAFNIPATGAGTQKLAVGDINGDGRPDVVFCQSNYGDGIPNIAVVLNTTATNSPNFSGTTPLLLDLLTAPGATFLGSYPYEVKIADMNNDGKGDIITYSSQKISVFLSNTSISASTTSGISFYPRQDYTISGIAGFGGNNNVTLQRSSMDVGDLNNDGKVDVVIMSGDNDSFSAAKLNIFVNSTLANSTTLSWSFSASNSVSPAGVQFAQYFVCKIIDLDKNGYPEIVANGYQKMQVAINTTLISGANPTFLDPTAYMRSFDFFNNLAYAITDADFNGDGRSDITMATNITGSKINSWSNTSTVGGIPFNVLTTGGVSLATSNSFDFISVLPITTMRVQDLAGDDLDGDTKIDLILGSYDKGILHVFQNIRTSTLPSGLGFSAVAVLNTGAVTQPLSYDAPFTNSSNQIEIADFNLDGRKDIITFGQDGLTVFRNNPSITSISPAAANDGQIVTLKGSWLSALTQVTFANGVTVPVTNTGINTFQANVPSGNITGPLTFSLNSTNLKSSVSLLMRKPATINGLNPSSVVREKDVTELTFTGINMVSDASIKSQFVFNGKTLNARFTTGGETAFITLSNSDLAVISSGGVSILSTVGGVAYSSPVFSQLIVMNPQSIVFMPFGNSFIYKEGLSISINPSFLYSSSGLVPTLSLTSIPVGIASLGANNTINITGTGTVTAFATQTGDGINWWPAPSASNTIRSFEVTPKPTFPTPPKDTLSLNDYSLLESISLSPNPFQTGFTLNAFYGANYSISDLSGRVLLQGLALEKETYISTTKLSEGIYILTVISGNGKKKNIKLVKS